MLRKEESHLLKGTQLGEADGDVNSDPHPTPSLGHPHPTPNFYFLW